jgi:hypothetical protein
MVAQAAITQEATIPSGVPMVVTGTIEYSVVMSMNRG